MEAIRCDDPRRWFQPATQAPGSTVPAIPSSFSPDGRRLAYYQAGAGTQSDLWTLPLDTTDPLAGIWRRILGALAEGENDAQKLADLGSERLHASEAGLIEVLRGELHPAHRRLLQCYLERWDLLEMHEASLRCEVSLAMQAHQQTVARLCELPGVADPGSAGDDRRSA